MRNLHELPKIRDGLSYLYLEHCRIEQEAKAIAFYDANGKTPVPCAALALLLLGPGTNITHAAITALADNGCLVVWCGEQGVRFYAAGTGESRSARKLLHQARLCSDPDLRLRVVRRLYEMRFAEGLPEKLTLQQIRGKEGIRVREAYARASRETGVPWSGRNYNSRDWGSADPVNRALSTANSCLYGICHAAIVSAGYSPGLGFIHIGKQLSFVYDIADLYKTDTAIPAAFAAAASGGGNLEKNVRLACRDYFYRTRLLATIVDDIDAALTLPGVAAEGGGEEYDSDRFVPGKVWDEKAGTVDGGVNHSVVGGGEGNYGRDGAGES